MDPDPTPHEIAELLWLKDAISARDDVRESAIEPPGEASPSHTRAAGNAAPQSRVKGPAGQTHQAPATQESEENRNKGLFAKTGSDGTPLRNRSHQAREVSVPRLSVAREAEHVVRPLRRLKTVDGARPHEILDEEATADATAESGHLTPVLRPDSEQWFDLALVVDVGSSMVLWDEVVRDFRRSCQRLGVFRDVRVWQLGRRSGRSRSEFAVRPEPSRGAKVSSAPTWRDLAQLRDPAGRRLVLVLTDGMAEPWRHDRTLSSLARIGASNPIAIVHLLPQRVWHRTRLQPCPVLWTRASEGTLALSIKPVADPPGPASWVPVLRLSEHWLETWVGVIAGPVGHQAEGMAVSSYPPERHERSTRSGRSTARSAPALVDGFLSTVSPDAARLATYLAAAPLTLPVMRVVQKAMLPESDPATLAEVFLSGLLTQVEPAANVDHVHFDFRPGVRRELLAVLARTEALRVLDVLSTTSEAISAEFGGSLDFKALVRDVDGSGTVPVRARPFAVVASSVLRAIGGQYRDIAERLDVGLPPAPADENEEVAAVQPRLAKKASPVRALVDDLDGTDAEETVKFSLDGIVYEIDLSAANAARLREIFAPYVEVGAKVRVEPQPRRGKR